MTEQTKHSTDDFLYKEKVASQKTELLFLGLTMGFLALFFWRINAGDLDGFAALFLVLFLFFLFYSQNYRTLIITITAKRLKLRFGIFSWTIPLDNIESCALDALPSIKRWGGAGIHFMVVRKRYRASFNFLEHPRVVVALKKKRGPVRDLSFSTQQPDEVMKALREAQEASK